MKQDVIQAIKKLDKKASHNSKAHHFHFPDAVDKTFKWVPLGTVLALDATGVKAKNNVQDQLLLMSLAEGVMNAVLQPVKYSVHRMRPDHSLDIKSFPSGHTATSFLGAEILRRETEHVHKGIGYGAYAVAATTAALRIYNNKHWLSDVVVGAALGFISARIAYGLLKMFKKKNAKPVYRINESR